MNNKYHINMYKTIVLGQMLQNLFNIVVLQLNVL